MYLPASFGEALTLTVLSAVFWGSWANSFKGARNCSFALFYLDYILGVIVCTVVFALTLGSLGRTGEPFFVNLSHATFSNFASALLAGIIFNMSNVLLTTAIDIAGMAIAFPLAIGIAVVEGVILSYALQPKGNIALIGAGVLLAVAAVLFIARAYRTLAAEENNKRAAVKTQHSSLGINLSIIAGILVGAFPPFVARALTVKPVLTPYTTAVVFGLGFICCLPFNIYLMRRPLQGAPVAIGDYWRMGARNHILGLISGVAWGTGTCLNFVAAGFVGVPISYAIGQSAPMIAAGWGVLVWREFAGAPAPAWHALGMMVVCYIAAIVLIASA